MNKFLTICVFFLTTIVLLLALSVLDEEKEVGLAFDSFNQPYQPTACDLGIIPLGSATFETIDALDFVYKAYKEDLQVHLTSLIKSGDDLLDALTIRRPDVCDFSKCQAKPKETLIDFGADIKITECLVAGEVCDLVTQICFSGCRQFACKGDPCLQDDVARALEDFELSQDLIAVDFQTIDDFYNLKQVAITKDIEKQGDTEQMTTILDHAWRKAELGAVSLMPYSGKGEETCMPNASQRKLIERDELLPRETMPCTKALEARLYWPEASSEWCSRECAYGSDDDCLACLRTECSPEQREFSWLADINCQLFNDCSAECGTKQNLDEQCNDCLCQRFEDDKDSEQACLDWVCGGGRGASFNQVCCQ